MPHIYSDSKWCRVIGYHVPFYMLPTLQSLATVGEASLRWLQPVVQATFGTRAGALRLPVGRSTSKNIRHTPCYP